MTSVEQRPAQGRARTHSRESAIEAAGRVAASFAATSAEFDRIGAFPHRNYDTLFEDGLLTITIPTEFGGAGLGIATVVRVLEKIGEGDPSTALVLSMTYLQHLGAGTRRSWPANVYERVCRESFERPTLLNAARVEPELGTPARGGLPATIAVKTGGGWRISGRKIYTTGSPVLRYATVWARTDDSTPRVGSFLVPLNHHGVVVEETWDHLGMRSSGSHDLVLTDVVIPEEYALDLRLPEEWRGADPQAGHAGSLAISAIYHGAARSARDWLVRYLQERTPTNLGASLSTLPRVQEHLGEIEALLYTSERLIYGLADDLEAGRPAGPVDPGLVKHVATNNSVAVVKKAIDLVGNPGLFRSNPLERHFRDVLCGPVHTPQDDVVLQNAGLLAFKARPHTTGTF